MLQTLRHFTFTGLISLGVLLAVLFWLGPGAVAITLILMAIELAFSFDNAIINAKTLKTMSPFWQRMFLSVGVIIAVFGMRVVFPIVIVMLTSHTGWGPVLDLALHHPEEYAVKLEASHIAISSFGGAFLAVLSLNFFFDDSRDVFWIRRIELPLQRLATAWLPSILALAIVGFMTLLPNNPEPAKTWWAGVAGIAVYIIIRGITMLVARYAGQDARSHHTGAAAFMAFLYLEVLDASFSFDGVVGAFAISNDVILIAAGLGIGALWVRSLTVYMVRRELLDSYRYIEHGAHYAIAVLALAMILSVIWNIPEFVTGVVGLGLIAASVVASRQAIARDDT